MNYYIQAMKKYADFSGRARRKEYWIFTLFNMLFTLIAFVIDIAIGLNGGLAILGVASIVYGLAVFIPGLSLCVRRLHDVGKPGSYIFLSLIPLIGTFILIAYMCKEGDVGQNVYGADPKTDAERTARVADADTSAKRRAAHSLVMIGIELAAFVLFFIVVARIGSLMGNNILRVFFNPGNLRNLTMIFMPIALTALGATMVFSRGSYDFSIGGVMFLSGVVAASLLASESPFAIPAAIAVAFAIGLINALCAGAAKKAGFLVTIATAALARYIGMGISGYASIPLNSDGLSAVAGAAFWIVLVLAAVGAAYATRGRKQKTGFAHLCLIALPYVFSSLLACAAGIFMMYRLNCSVPGIGTNSDIYIIFAIALSGSFFGARNANIPGVLVGSLLAAALNNVLSLMNVQVHAQMICLCAIIVVWFLLNWLIARIMFPNRREAR